MTGQIEGNRAPDAIVHSGVFGESGMSYPVLSVVS